MKILGKIYFEFCLKNCEETSGKTHEAWSIIVSSSEPDAPTPIKASIGVTEKQQKLTLPHTDNCLLENPQANVPTQQRKSDRPPQPALDPTRDYVQEYNFSLNVCFVSTFKTRDL